MKRFLLFCLSAFLLAACGSNGLLSKKQLKEKNYQEVVGSEVGLVENTDTQPMYPNGLKGIYQHVSKNTVYPQKAVDEGIQGTVWVGFIIDTKGFVKRVNVEKGVSKELDAEAVRVIELMDRWYPAMLNGNPVAVHFTQPIKFQMN